MWLKAGSSPNNSIEICQIDCSVEKGWAHCFAWCARYLQKWLQLGLLPYIPDLYITFLKEILNPESNKTWFFIQQEVGPMYVEQLSEIDVVAKLGNKIVPHNIKLYSWKS